MNGKTIISKSYRETIKSGRQYARDINPGDVIGLKGELGTGKTQFVKGICEYFRVKDIVNSPTFLIVNEYKGIKNGCKPEISIYHFDLYRIKYKEELETIGFREYLKDDSVCLIEWCELFENYDEINMRLVSFEFGKGINERIIKY